MSDCSCEETEALEPDASGAVGVALVSSIFEVGLPLAHVGVEVSCTVTGRLNRPIGELKIAFQEKLRHCAIRTADQVRVFGLSGQQLELQLHMPVTSVDGPNGSRFGPVLL